jgi:thiol-disulfide isomerase/thioredoxin
MSSPLVALFGETLEGQDGKPVATSTALASLDAVGIYFSAHWCPPCRGFTPVLATKYQELKKAGKKVEIVFCSSDSDASAFQGYAKEQPWIRLPYADRKKKEELSNKYGVRGIPTLVFIDGNTGDVITTGGRGAVSAGTFIEDFPYHPKPCYDLADNLEGIQSEPSLILLMESADAETKTNLSQELWALAEQEKLKPSADQRVGKFFTGAKGEGPISQIRKGAGYTSADKAPVMLILDLNDDGSVYTPEAGKTEVSSANISDFLTSFKAGSLTKKKWIS